MNHPLDTWTHTPFTVTVNSQSFNVYLASEGEWRVQEDVVDGNGVRYSRLHLHDLISDLATA